MQLKFRQGGDGKNAGSGAEEWEGGSCQGRGKRNCVESKRHGRRVFDWEPGDGAGSRPSVAWASLMGDLNRPELVGIRAFRGGASLGRDRRCPELGGWGMERSVAERGKRVSAKIREQNESLVWAPRVVRAEVCWRKIGTPDRAHDRSSSSPGAKRAPVEAVFGDQGRLSGQGRRVDSDFKAAERGGTKDRDGSEDEW